MESGNSGSMQSSSGGDDDYDSRAESISVFLNNNNNPLTQVGPMPNPPPAPAPAPAPPSNRQHHHHSPSSFVFDPLSNFFDPLSSSRSPTQFTTQNSLLNLDTVWSKNLRSDTTCTDFGGFISSSSSPTQQFFTNQPPSRPDDFPSIQIPQAQETAATRASASAPNDQTTGSNNLARNPKKRSRASRRAPTTVLTTDTTNFRAMVQEFTGIPSPPFTSSPFPRSRLDLFGTSSTFRSATHLDSPTPPYLLRPFAQKIPPFSTSSSSSIVDALASSTTASNINSGSNPSTATSSNNLLSSDLSLLKQPQNLLNINMQNPVLSFHSLLQPNSPKFPILGTAKQNSLEIPGNDSQVKMGVLDEFALSHVNSNLTGLPNVVSSSSDTSLRRSENNRGDEADHHQGFLRSINASNYNSSRRVSSNGKINFSASSSDFHGDKGPENLATRTEGTMESWICSSD